MFTLRLHICIGISEFRSFGCGVYHSDLLHWALSTGYDLIYVWRHLQAATSGKCLTGHPHLRCPQEAVRNATIPILGKADMTY